MHQWMLLWVTLAALGCFIGYVQFEERQRILAQESDRLKIQAEVVEKNLVPQLLLANRVIEGILHDLPEWQAQNDGYKRGSHQLQVINDTLIGIRPILVISADGTVIASSNETLIGMSFAQREYFKTAVSNPDPKILHVSAPFKTVLDTFVISLYRIIPGPNGGFGGIVIVSVVPEYFSNLLDSVQYAPDLRTSIIHGDGKIFLTSPKAGLDGKDLAKPGTFFSLHKESGRLASVFVGKVYSTGEERMIAHRTIRITSPGMDKPLVVAVGREFDAILAPWRRSFYQQSLLFLALILVACAGRYFYQRRQLSFARATALNEAALLGARELIDEVQKLSMLGGWKYDCSTRRVSWTDEVYRIHGVGKEHDPDDAESNRRFYSAEDALTVRTAFKRAVNNGVPYDLDLRVTRLDGQRIWVRITGVPRIDDGRVVSVTGYIIDITERKQSETALQESERLLRESQSVAGLGSYVLDVPTGSWMSSDVFDRIFGIDQSHERTVEAWETFLHPDDRAMMADYFRSEVLGQGLPFDKEYRIIRQDDGALRWVHGLGKLELDDQGRPVKMHGTIQDITERKAATEQIEHLAFYDPLTDLPNRRLMLDRLEQALTSSARRHRYGALMLIDLDNFKTLNDTLGHNIGDKLLVEVASRISACIRLGDTVARLGGDEFVVVLQDLDDSETAALQAEGVAEKILAHLCQPYLLNLSLNGEGKSSRSHHCTSSIGITLFGESPVTADELMKRADTAMYQAKAAGRNTLRFFDPIMQAAVTKRAAVEVDLRKAVDEQQFIVYFQPQIDASGRVSGAEALVRWRHPERGLVFPDEFIHLAEETELILPLGQWVLECACAQLAFWEKSQNTAHLSLAVNVSARQLHHADFVTHVFSALDASGVDPRRLKLEITESLLLENVEDIIFKMSVLKARGVGFSLDDFGTGYSSLSYLKRLPLDQLKIDRSFVRDILVDANDAAIARTIVALGQSLGLSVIAEGVETEEQRAVLAGIGCTAYQGYLFSRPLPIDGFEEYLRRV
jgi:diguanylate cyclase (GGDEF)-like protein/PAS domain S-box-containing protein